MSFAEGNWGSLIWEPRQPVPKRTGTIWRLPDYPNKTGQGREEQDDGVVYRLCLFYESKWRNYIGQGGKTAREQIESHLSDSRKHARAQRMMREHTKSGVIEVWTLARTSTLEILGRTIHATCADFYNRMLFEAAALVHAANEFPEEELLNPRYKLPYRGNHKKAKLGIAATDLPGIYEAERELRRF